MVKFIFAIIVCWFINVSLAQDTSQVKCIMKWSKNFEGFAWYRETIPFSKKLPLNETQCLSDTAHGLKLLSVNLFYGSQRKSKSKRFEYFPTYLSYSTCEMKPFMSNPNSSQRITGVDIPMEIIKMYYISALFYSDFCFRKKLHVVTKNGGYLFDSVNKKKEGKILWEAEKAIKKWALELEEKGLEQMRKEGKDPMYYTNLKFID